MPKLSASPANVNYVADDLAAAGSRDAVTLAAVRRLVAGTEAEISRHFDAWREGVAAETADGAMAQKLAEIERRLTAAIQGARPAPRADASGGPVRRGAGVPDRNAEAEDLAAVARYALSDQEPEGRKSFTTEVWDKRARTVRRTLKPAGAPPAPHGKMRPDTPKEIRRVRAAERNAAVRDLPQGRPRTLRRVDDADWQGAFNTYVAAKAATVLRNAGYPLMPSEICNELAARWDIRFRFPARDLPPALEGSRMVQVGARGQFWFENERTTKRPPPPTDRDTPEALTRRLAKSLFTRTLEILRLNSPKGMTPKDLRTELGEEVGDFNRDWLAQRLKREVADPMSKIHKVERGFAWIEPKAAARQARRMPKKH